MGSGNTAWKEITSYTTSAETYWHDEIDEGGGTTAEKLSGKNSITSHLEALSTGYTNYTSALQLTGGTYMSGGYNPYLVNLYTYVSNVSSVSGIPSNMSYTLQFKTNVGSTGTIASTTTDDLRNSVLAWSYIGTDYSQLFSIPSPPVSATLLAGYSTALATIDNGYAGWKTYMDDFVSKLTDELRRGSTAVIWDSSIGAKMGTDTDIWPLSSGPDIRAILLSGDNITTGTGATVIPMHFDEVLYEIGWQFVGINVDPTY
jgi:hypothetical protein